VVARWLAVALGELSLATVVGRAADRPGVASGASLALPWPHRVTWCDRRQVTTSHGFDINDVYSAALLPRPSLTGFQRTASLPWPLV